VPSRRDRAGGPRARASLRRSVDRGGGRAQGRSAGPVTAAIQSLTHDGRGVAHVDGKAVFIAGALPGEQVEFVYTDRRRDYAEGRLVGLLVPAPERVEARCAHYGTCGGCSLQHVAPGAQVAIKEQLLLEQLRRIGGLPPPELWPPLGGEPWGYRCRARLAVVSAGRGEGLVLGFREKGRATVAAIDTCPVLHPAVGRRLSELRRVLERLSIRAKIPGIEVAVGDEVAVVAVRVLATPTPEDRDILREFARATGLALSLQHAAGAPPVALDGGPEISPSYALPAFDLRMRFRPGTFVQANPAINRRLVDRVVETLEASPRDQVLDLYCGLGNFTLPMARLAGRVVGVEGDPALLEQAEANARDNGIRNVEFHAADLSADIGDRHWALRRYDQVVLDPPRAGACALLGRFAQWQPRRILYVSCDPATLARDAGVLVRGQGYRLARVGVVDMFPHTGHVESLALFVRGEGKRVAGPRRAAAAGQVRPSPPMVSA